MNESVFSLFHSLDERRAALSFWSKAYRANVRITFSEEDGYRYERHNRVVDPRHGVFPCEMVELEYDQIPEWVFEGIERFGHILRAELSQPMPKAYADWFYHLLDPHAELKVLAFNVAYEHGKPVAGEILEGGWFPFIVKGKTVSQADPRLADRIAKFTAGKLSREAAIGQRQRDYVDEEGKKA